MQVSTNPLYKGWAKRTIKGVGWDKLARRHADLFAYYPNENSFPYETHLLVRFQAVFALHHKGKAQ